MPPRILVRLPNWLGDALLARPLLHALRAGAPGAELIGIAPAPLLGLVAWDGTLDVAHAWERDGRARAALVHTLRATPPDAALVLPPSFSSAWFAWRTGARTRVGYASEGRSPLLTHALARAARGDHHLSDEYLELGRPLGADVGPDAGVRAVPVPRLVPPPEAVAAAAETLVRLGLAPGARYAVLGPGAIYGPAKRWPAERYAGLARAIVERGMRVLVCGTRAESGVCAEVAARAGEGAHDLAGATGLEALAGIVAGARVAVCNDSGLAHLCAAVGTPTVAIFGSTSSAWTAPRGERVTIVQQPPVCSPCFARTCRIGYGCLTAIGVERVARACDAALEGQAA